MITPEEREAMGQELSKRIAALFLGSTPPFSVAAVGLGKFVSSTMAGVLQTRGPKALEEWIKLYYATLILESKKVGIAIDAQFMTETPKPEGDDDLVDRLRRRQEGGGDVQGS